MKWKKSLFHILYCTILYGTNLINGKGMHTLFSRRLNPHSARLVLCVSCIRVHRLDDLQCQDSHTALALLDIILVYLLTLW